MKEYSLNCDENTDTLDQSLVKDKKYRLQNEWRLIAFGEEHLIDNPTGHWILDIGKFDYAVSLRLEMLKNGEFSIKEREK